MITKERSKTKNFDYLHTITFSDATYIESLPASSGVKYACKITVKDKPEQPEKVTHYTLMWKNESEKEIWFNQITRLLSRMIAKKKDKKKKHKRNVSDESPAVPLTSPSSTLKKSNKLKTSEGKKPKSKSKKPEKEKDKEDEDDDEDDEKDDDKQKKRGFLSKVKKFQTERLKESTDPFEKKYKTWGSRQVSSSSSVTLLTFNYHRTAKEIFSLQSLPLWRNQTSQKNLLLLRFLLLLLLVVTVVFRQQRTLKLIFNN